MHVSIRIDKGKETITDYKHDHNQTGAKHMLCNMIFAQGMNSSAKAHYLTG